MYFGAIIIGGVFALIGAYIQNKLKSKFKKYSKLSLRNGLSGKEIAEKMLRDHNITDVEVISVKGQLTDHYNPIKKTVNLSEVVYNERNASAAAVAAHEVGHAVQHAKGYAWLKMRSSLVPVVSISSKAMPFVLAIGVGLAVAGKPFLLLIGIALFAATTLFSIITLPVEFDASNRALAWLEETNTVTPEEHDGSKDALKWAAMTYVAAALASLAMLLYYISIYASNKR